MLRIAEINSLSNSILNEIDLCRAQKPSDFSKDIDLIYAYGVVLGLRISQGMGYDDEVMCRSIGKKSFRFLKKRWGSKIGSKVPHIKRKEIKPIEAKKEKPIKYQTSEELSAANYKSYLMFDDDYRKSIGLEPLPPADPIIV